MLFKKLLRTMGRYRAQFISMIIMIALGIGVFTGFSMEWYSLEKNTRAMYRETGFSDYRMVSETGFSEDDLAAVAALDGVREATRYLSVNTTVKDDSDVLALTVSTNMRVSGVMLMAGDPYDETDENGFWLSDQYAEKNGVRPGDRLTLVYKDLEISGTVQGLVKSAEYLICLPDKTQVMPDYNSYGFVYASPALLARVLGTPFYTQINVLSDLDKAVFTTAADRALGKTVLILSKDETVSYSEAQGEVNEGKTMAGVLPVLFLSIAILTMVTTMHRLTASEKTQIGTLKALGFRDRVIAAHYTSYALFIGVVGSTLGIGIGYLLGWYIMNPKGAMGTYIDMRDWKLYMPLYCWVILVLINAFLVLIGFLSVKSMLRGTAADALRPFTPRTMRRGRIENTKWWKNKLRFGTKWNLRDCFCHKARTGMTLFGIIGCMVLLVGALGMKDTLDSFIDVFYNKAIQYETRINLDAAVTHERAAELAEQYAGDWCAAEGVQITDRAVSLEVYHITRDKVRFTDEDMNFITLGQDGAYVCARIAKEHGLAAGDTLTFSPYGSDATYSVRVLGVLRTMSESIVMSDSAADAAGIPYHISAIFTDATDVAADPAIVNTQSKQSIIDSFDTFTELMVTMVFLLVTAAIVLGIVVLYNLGVMSYTERYREMATLKVLGFRDRQIGRLLIGQNLWLTVIGIAVGLPAGVGVLQYLLVALASEYEMKLTLGPLTFGVSILLTLGVSLSVGLMIARKNRKIDMVEALKVAE